MPTDSVSDRLLGEGIALTLSNGDETRTVRLRFKFRGLKVLEDHFGGLDKALDALTGVVDAEGNSRRIDTLATFLAAGLTHEGFTPDSILDWIDLRTMAEIMEAITAAIGQSLPPPDDKATSPNAVGPPSPNPSPGSPSTVSPPSSSDAPMISSGTR